jgi:hypothetical protein
MKIIRINFQKIFSVAFLFLLIPVFGSISFAAKVELYRGQLLVNGEPFVVKGVNYSPVPIGIDPQSSPPYGDYFTADYSPIYLRDLPLLREMGANTIRLMVWNNNGSDHTDFLNKLQNSGVKPIYAIITFSMNPILYPDITSPDARDKIKADFRAWCRPIKATRQS